MTMSFPVAGFPQRTLVEVHGTPLSDEASGSAEVRSCSTRCLLLGCLSEDHVGLGRKARLQRMGSQPALQLGGSGTAHRHRSPLPGSRS